MKKIIKLNYGKEGIRESEIKNMFYHVTQTGTTLVCIHKYLKTRGYQISEFSTGLSLSGKIFSTINEARSYAETLCNELTTPLDMTVLVQQKHVGILNT